MFVRFNLLSSRNPREVGYWLREANVNGQVITIDGDVRAFVEKLENLGAKISSKDIVWMNNVCQQFLGRNYEAKEVVKSSTKIEVGVGANVANDNLNIAIKKMASWPSDNPRRIYVDCLVNGNDFHYYINLGGKQGRYSKDGSSEYNFQNFISKECEFLGVKDEKAVLEFRGTKGFYKKSEN